VQSLMEILLELIGDVFLEASVDTLRNPKKPLMLRLIAGIIVAIFVVLLVFVSYGLLTSFAELFAEKNIPVILTILGIMIFAVLAVVVINHFFEQLTKAASNLDE